MYQLSTTIRAKTAQLALASGESARKPIHKGGNNNVENVI